MPRAAAVAGEVDRRGLEPGVVEGLEDRRRPGRDVLVRSSRRPCPGSSAALRPRAPPRRTSRTRPPGARRGGTRRDAGCGGHRGGRPSRSTSGRPGSPTGRSSCRGRTTRLPAGTGEPGSRPSPSARSSMAGVSPSMTTRTSFFFGSLSPWRELGGQRTSRPRGAGAARPRAGPSRPRGSRATG